MSILQLSAVYQKCCQVQMPYEDLGSAQGSVPLRHEPLMSGDLDIDSCQVKGWWLYPHS